MITVHSLEQIIVKLIDIHDLLWDQEVLKRKYPLDDISCPSFPESHLIRNEKKISLKHLSL